MAHLHLGSLLGSQERCVEGPGYFPEFKPGGGGDFTGRVRGKRDETRRGGAWATGDRQRTGLADVHEVGEPDPGEADQDFRADGDGRQLLVQSRIRDNPKGGRVDPHVERLREEINRPESAGRPAEAGVREARVTDAALDQDLRRGGHGDAILHEAL
ncbi:MAG: hypothetical protein HY928_08520 [Elusimicrobia bacterium]|nr:hypothetical protein [Elusimicrobiota bacterium]